MYLGEANYVLYLRDRAFLNYTFMKLGKEGWKDLAHPTGEAPDPNAAPARAAFLAEYDLPEYRKPMPTRLAMSDLRQALKRKRVPNWVLGMLRAEEVKALTG